jgi:hypothetical protein
MRLRLVIFLRRPVLVRARFTHHRHWRGRCEGTRTDEGERDEGHQKTAQ